MILGLYICFMEKDNNMKDFIAIIFGDFNTSQKVYDAMLTITPVVESENLKFQYNDLSIICHFQSMESQQDIQEFFNVALFELCGMFFITETKNMSIFMDQQMTQHLMNLEASENVNMAIDMDKVRNGQDGLLEQDLMNIPIVFDKEEDEDDDIKILKKKPVEPTLDDILEKIHIYGYDSLSDNELKLLNKYSN
jgi:hypothetical protein